MRKIKAKHSRVKLGDLVFTYDFRLAQVLNLEYSNDLSTDINITAVKLNTGEVMEPYEVAKVKRIGYQAKKVLRERGKCMI